MRHVFSVIGEIKVFTAVISALIQKRMEISTGRQVAKFSYIHLFSNWNGVGISCNVWPYLPHGISFDVGRCCSSNGAGIVHGQI